MFLLLLALWIIFNGKFTVEILIFGIVISLVVSVFAVKFLKYSFKQEFKLLKKLPYLIAYCFVLVWEIIKANVVTTKFVIKGMKKNKPIVYTFTSPVKSSFAQTLLANSITLTPGTISVSLKDNVYRVHCLDESLSDGIEQCSFVKLLIKIEENL
ncbi:MAG: Na+/H+ antiporter subunit E [Lachnospiraceae bacterium]|nr:Na+/H+ antiporter subunit E [Lachnospiraceae bacterium]